MKSNYVKRTQQDYSMSFKLQMVKEIEQGLLTWIQGLDKYGIQARSMIEHSQKNMVNLIITLP